MTRGKYMTSDSQKTYFAKGYINGRDQLIGINSKDRRHHFYLIGKTGTGKTTMLENMLIADINAGRGIGLIDPHGDLAGRLLSFVPSRRINHVVYFNPGDIGWPIAFNILDNHNKDQSHLVASFLVSVFKKIWLDSWGPRLEHILRNTILALLECSQSTLLGALKLLVDERYRKRVIHKIKDPVVKSFWNDEFENYPERFLREAISPLQNKLGALLANRIIRNIIGQPRTLLNIEHIMNSEKILIVNLSKGLIGDDASRLLGSMIVTAVQLAAMARAKMPETERKDFYLYIDEFHNFSTTSFIDILSEARKYRLNLTLAHQYLDQLEPEIKSAVLGNAGSIVAFRLGADDAKSLENEFQPEYGWLDLVNLYPHEIYYKLMLNGKVLRPYPAECLPPVSDSLKTNLREKIIESSRRRYCRKKEIVEKQIETWMQAPHI